MTQKIYSIHDAKAEYFTQPFFKKTHGEAERDFTQLVNDEKSQLHKFPEDYDLYYLGEYDDNTGKMTPIDTPQHIIKAIQIRSKSMQ
jgi:hypothetical protein